MNNYSSSNFTFGFLPLFLTSFVDIFSCNASSSSGILSILLVSSLEDSCIAESRLSTSDNILFCKDGDEYPFIFNSSPTLFRISLLDWIAFPNS